ncbi:biopolymer transport protein ExbD [Dysgonomonas sp. PFB1-18]|uniref:ExbD/TolR family protein n=1 Tax=unclassified Dysgonomonas TaxID=2630389 RepID=UPI002476B2A0|nr:MULTISPECIES: biopolymer transporter ExbD [unclassified Dysgonomonas]MDH6308346.1 biopolymer transport protein ExbD [Dysgonomonas sp. PF1-14]MDH6338217.1 biopolymer transport protein ExbD [Dysgonomonas sp. PF1-16]MDH6379714.1 biopolymer transport protein ExbD [Dysgonomonas sp. PFB1-18]MDH6397197.1 biopolymer transport protein ExbD [Dysgonomonas sp. PF1-23]
MGKIKVKKQSTFIDMTAMSDVTVLLLTFFMLTATFLPKEPVQVTTPSSVSETKIPESNVLTILIDPQGKVFLNLDRPETKKAVLELMGQDYGMTFTPKQINSFVEQSHIGVPMSKMNGFLNLSLSDQDDEIKKMGVPLDSANNQFARWVKHAREVGGDGLGIAIKADQNTPYPLVDDVLKALVKMKENRYSLVTALRAAPSNI